MSTDTLDLTVALLFGLTLFTVQQKLFSTNVSGPITLSSFTPQFIALGFELIYGIIRLLGFL